MPHGKICYLEIPANRAEDAAEFYARIFRWKVRPRGDGNLAFDDPGGVSGTWVKEIGPPRHGRLRGVRRPCGQRVGALRATPALSARLACGSRLTMVGAGNAPAEHPAGRRSLHDKARVLRCALATTARLTLARMALAPYCRTDILPAAVQCAFE